MTSEQTTKKSVPGPVIGALADAFGKSFLTIQRWIKNDDIILSTDLAKRVFSDWNYKWENGQLVEATEQN